MCRINLYIGTSLSFAAAFGPSALAPGLLAAALAGCDAAPPSVAAADAGASPNAAILPAPLATEPPDLFDAGAALDDVSRGAPVTADSARPESASRPIPEPFRASTPVSPDWPPSQKDASGVTLDAVFRPRDVPPPPRAAEVSSDAHRDAQKLTTLALRIDLAESGRMRAELTGSAFLLPAHTELRARADRYGHLLLWPNGASYRVVPAGALRPLLGERRLDTMPLSGGVARAQGEGRRLGVSVRKVDVSSSIGTVRLEIGRVPESGEGGALLCRALVELGGTHPRTPVCKEGEVPLAASYAWQEGGGIAFEVTALAKRTDLPASAFLVPPASATMQPAGLPAVPNGIFLARETLAALRTAPVALPAPRDPMVPGEGFVAVNHGDRLMVLSLDGIPALWVPPFGEQYVVGPLRGRYLVQWRTFLGEKVLGPQLVEVPARLVYGVVPDGGAPDGGGP